MTLAGRREHCADHLTGDPGTRHTCLSNSEIPTVPPLGQKLWLVAQWAEVSEMLGMLGDMVTVSEAVLATLTCVWNITALMKLPAQSSPLYESHLLPSAPIREVGSWSSHRLSNFLKDSN